MHPIVFEIGAFVLFLVLSFVLTRDDGPFGRLIRAVEILLPLTAALAVYEAWSRGADIMYFMAAVCFGLALLYALTRRVFEASPFPLGFMGGGMAIFFYGVFVLAGSFFAALATFDFDPFPK
jgi:hypothetical protein